MNTSSQRRRANAVVLLEPVAFVGDGHRTVGLRDDMDKVSLVLARSGGTFGIRDEIRCDIVISSAGKGAAAIAEKH